MADIAVKIVLDDEHLGQCDKMSVALENIGVKVEEVISELGVIFGKADEKLMPMMLDIDGVLEVEPEDIYQLPPMSEDIPQ